MIEGEERTAVPVADEAAEAGVSMLACDLCLDSGPSANSLLASISCALSALPFFSSLHSLPFV